MNKDINKEIEYHYYRHPDPMIEYLIRQAMWDVHFDPKEEYEWESEDNPWLDEEDDPWLDEEDDLWLDDLQ